MHTADNPPRCYLSTSQGRWTVVYQGMPLCADKQTRAEAEAAARQMKAAPAAIWNGDTGQFQPLEG